MPELRLRLPNLTSYSEREAAWDRAVASLPLPGPGSSQDLVIALLEQQLDRAVAVIKLNDDKASLVIPAVGVVTGIVGSNVRPDIGSQAALAILGLVAAIAGVAAIVLAIVSLSPKTYANGPIALSAVLGSGVAVDVGKLNYLKALGLAVQSAEDLVKVKAFWVTWAFRAGALGIGILTLFTAFGGFAIGGTK